VHNVGDPIELVPFVVEKIHGQGCIAIDLDETLRLIASFDLVSPTLVQPASVAPMAQRAKRGCNAALSKVPCAGMR